MIQDEKLRNFINGTDNYFVKDEKLRNFLGFENSKNVTDDNYYKDSKKNLANHLIGTPAYLLYKGGLGFFNAFEDVSDFALQSVGLAADGIGLDKTADFLEKVAKNDTVDTVFAEDKVDKAAQTATGLKNPETNFLTNVASGVGNIGGQVVLGQAISPLHEGTSKVGKAVTNLNKTKLGNKLVEAANMLPTVGAGAFSNAYNQAREEGAERKDAALYGTLSGLKETGIEALSGGIGGTGGSIGGKTIKEMLTNAAGEAGEEVLADLIDPINQKLTYNKNMSNEEFISKYNPKDLMETAGSAFASSLLFNAGTEVGAKAYNKNPRIKAIMDGNFAAAKEGIIKDLAKFQKKNVTPRVTTELKKMQDSGADISDTVTELVEDDAYYLEEIGDIVSKLNENSKEKINVLWDVDNVKQKGYMLGNTIHLNPNLYAEEKYRTFIHELTHMLEKTEDYDNYANMVIRTLQEKGEYDNLYNATKELYEKNLNKKLSKNYIQAEMIAKTTEGLFKNRQLTQALYTDNKGIFNKVKNFVDEKIAEYKAKKNMTETEKFDYDLLKRTQKMYIQVLQNKNKLSFDEQLRIKENEMNSNNKLNSFGNSGYVGQSMSKRAASAYEDGRKPLSKFNSEDLLEVNSRLTGKERIKSVKELKLVLEKTSGHEWHHTGSYYNKTNFYDVEDIFDNDDIDNIIISARDYIKNEKEELKKAKESEKGKVDLNKYKGDISYIEWIGTRNHPKANHKVLENVNIEEKGQFYIITNDNGEVILRKKIGSNGTEVTKKYNAEQQKRIDEENAVAKEEKRILSANYETMMEAEQKIIKKFFDEQDKEIKNNSTKNAYAIYQKMLNDGYTTSYSGNMYFNGEKPSREEYEENSIKDGTKRIKLEMEYYNPILYTHEEEKIVTKDGTIILTNKQAEKIAKNALEKYKETRYKYKHPQVILEKYNAKEKRWIPENENSTKTIEKNNNMLYNDNQIDITSDDAKYSFRKYPTAYAYNLKITKKIRELVDANNIRADNAEDLVILLAATDQNSNGYEDMDIHEVEVFARAARENANNNLLKKYKTANSASWTWYYIDINDLSLEEIKDIKGHLIYTDFVIIDVIKIDKIVINNVKEVEDKINGQRNTRKINSHNDVFKYDGRINDSDNDTRTSQKSTSSRKSSTALRRNGKKQRGNNSQYDNGIHRGYDLENVKAPSESSKEDGRVFSFDPDSDNIKYSLDPKGNVLDQNGKKVTFEAEEVSDDKSLLAIHNLSESNLWGIVELGGFPFISIAVIDTNKGSHNQFGGISVVFSKDTIDPENEKNEVYDRDVWSPTFPAVEYDIKNENIQKYIKKNIDFNYRDGIIDDVKVVYLYEENLKDKINSLGIEETLRRIKEDKKVMYLYKTLVEKDENYKPIMYFKRYDYDYPNDVFKEFIKNFGNKISLDDFYYHYFNYRDKHLTEEQYSKLKSLIKKSIIPILEEEKYNRLKKENKYNEESIKRAKTIIEKMTEWIDNNNFKIEDFIRNAAAYEEYGEYQVIDEYKTLEKIESQTNKKEFESWVDDTFGVLFQKTKKGIRNDKDIFTKSGNRRSFNQTHEPYNLESVVKEMAKQETVSGQNTFFSGFGQISANLSKKFNSIDEIRDYKSRLMNNKEVNEIIKPISEKIKDDMFKLEKYFNGKYNGLYFMNELDKEMRKFEIITEAINKFARKKYITIDSLKNVLKDTGYIDADRVPGDILKNIVEDLNSMKNLPTDYFEAKPRRAILFDEVKSILFPKGTNKQLIEKIKKINPDIKFIEYDYELDGDRENKIKSLDDLKFSFAQDDVIDGFYSQLERTIESKINTMPANQALKVLQNNGVKQDELNYTGVKEYLESKGEEKITKDELLELAQNNRFHYEEKTFGDGSDSIKKLNDLYDKEKEVRKNIQNIKLELSNTILSNKANLIKKYPKEWVEKLIDFNISNINDLNTALLLKNNKILDILSAEDVKKIKASIKQLEKYQNEINKINDEQKSVYKNTNYMSYSTNIEQNKPFAYSENLYINPTVFDSKHRRGNYNMYSSPHWEEKNVLYHVRDKIFNDSQNNKILFIEEVQSDMHQHGRKEGYFDFTGDINKNLLKVKEKYNEYFDLREEILELQKIQEDKKIEYVKEFSNLLKEDYPEIFKKYESDLKKYDENVIDMVFMFNDKEYSQLFKNKKLRVTQENYFETNNKIKELTEKLSDKLTQGDKIINYVTDDMKSFDKTNKSILEVMYKKIQENYIDSRIPFKKDWTLQAVKKVIKKAVENNVDKVAWTTGEQQNERYNLFKHINKIEYSKYDNKVNLDIDNGKINKEVNQSELIEYVGKDIASQILNDENDKGIINKETTIKKGLEKDGMSLYYDNTLPDIVDKYIKKYGSKVEELTINGSKQLGFKVTPEMIKEIQEKGQPLFSLEDTFEGRDESVLGDKKIALVMHNYPQLQPYFKNYAKYMLNNLEDTVKGERSYNGDVNTSTSRITSTEIEELLDMGYSYKKIEEALGNIIVGEYKNNALEKRIEYMLHKQMMYGYTDMYGMQIPPDKKYIDTYYKILDSENKKNEVIENIEEKDYKTRKTIKSISKSNLVDKTTKKYLKKELKEGNYVYEVTANKKQLQEANRKLLDHGVTELYRTINNKFKNGDLFNANEIVLTERLIQELTKKKQYDKAIDLIENVAVMATEAGRTVQALSVIKKLTPQGQLMVIQKTVDRMNERKDIIKKLEKAGKDKIKIDEEIKKKILSAEIGSVEMENAITEAAINIAEQIPPSLADKIMAWRYLAMLGNLRTHARNVVPNVFATAVNTISDQLAGILEDMVNPIERHKTFRKSSKEVIDFATEDADKNKKLISGNGKEDFNNLINSNRKNFKNSTLNKLSKFNSDMLEKEDWIFSKKNYIRALSKYITANNVDVAFLKGDTESANKFMEKARVFAAEEAKKAVFRNANNFARMLNNFEKQNQFAQIFVGGILPFKQTPINIFKTGIRFSPLGLLGSAKDFYDAFKGDGDINYALDNAAKGMTGTAIATIGLFLASLGVLQGADDEERKKANFDQYRGLQNYSIKIGDKSITLDWLSPVASCIFMGVETYNAMQKRGLDFNNFWDGTMKVVDPMAEMSMLSGLTSAITSFTSQSTAGSIGDIMYNVGESYLNQFIPTLLGQMARTIDGTVRETYYTDKEGIEADIQRTLKRAIAKIPGASHSLQPKIDSFGQEMKRTENVAARAFEQFIFPANVRKIEKNEVVDEITELYKVNKNTDILPSKYNGKYTYNGTDYKLSDTDYTKYAKEQGINNYNLIKQAINTDTYNDMSPEEKEAYIKGVYDYTKDKYKDKYAKEQSLEGYTTPSTLVTKENLLKEGVSLSNLEMYNAVVRSAKENQNLSSLDEYKILAKMKFSDTQKNKILKSKFKEDSKIKENISIDVIDTLETDEEYKKFCSNPEKYHSLKKMNIDFSVYSEISKKAAKIKKENSKIKSVKEKSKRNKRGIINLLNSYSLSDIERIIIFNSLGYSTKQYSRTIKNYLKELNISGEDTETILKQLGYKN